MKKMISALLLAALLLALPTGALAAKRASVKLPAKLGLMLEGSEVTLTPKLKRVAASQLTWESSDESVLQVWGGKLTALKAGKAVVKVSGGGAKAKCGVVVLPAQVQIGVGEKFTLPRGGREKYAVEDKKIAKVSKRGVVTGVSAGQTRLMARYGKQKVVLTVTVGAISLSETPVVAPEGIGDATRVVLVEYTGGSDAELSALEKKDGVWQTVLACKAYVGKNGVGKTQEGDKKTPLGVYNLTTPFGIKDDPGARMAYTKVTKYHYWCGDSSSALYNQLVDERVSDRKHTSADEYLINYKGVYNYAMFIDYNAEGTPHKGSAIFLHCTGKNKYTAGCVAIKEADMKKIVQWAGPGTKIVIREKQGTA